MSATRRGLIEAAGGAGLLAIAAAAFAKPDAAPAQQTPGAIPLDPAVHPDAELIALCAEFDALERRFQGLHGDGVLKHLWVRDDDAREAFLEPLEAPRAALSVRIHQARATTLDGLRARAHSLALYDLDQLAITDGPHSRMLAALLRDLTGGSVA